MMNAEFYTLEYVNGQMRESQKALFEKFNAMNDLVVQNIDHQLDVSYGPHSRQLLDLFFSQEACKGTILYFHPGYWQSRDKSDFRFLASTFTDRGYNLVLANYPLCPDVTLGALVEHTAQSVPFLLDYLKDNQPDEKGVLVAGHSAGGHIAVELAQRAWPTSVLGGRPIERIIAISGIYELVPLIQTPLNVKLKLDKEQAIANSPILRPKSVGVPATFIVGGDETSEFHRQSREMCDVWKANDNFGVYYKVPERDHFSILLDLVMMEDSIIIEAFDLQ